MISISNSSIAANVKDNKKSNPLLLRFEHRSEKNLKRKCYFVFDTQ